MRYIIETFISIAFLAWLIATYYTAFKLNCKRNEEQMNKQAILNKIEELKKLLEEEESKEWKPELKEPYYFVTVDNKVGWNILDEDYIDQTRLKALNVFRTEAEAQKEANKILTRRKLEKIAERLGKPSEEDWGKSGVYKHYIYIGRNDVLDCANDVYYPIAGVTYCLSDKFLEVAKEEIGEEALIEYCRG